MKLKHILLAFFIGVGIPGLLFFVVDKLVQRNNLPQEEESTVTETKILVTDPVMPADYTIPVLYSDGNVSNMELEQYLVGVLLGEMPMDFNIEALKAQAVVARTYTLRRNGIVTKHEGGAVCTESSCCQAYCSVEGYLENGGKSDAIEKAKFAILSTQGTVITYNGALIEATYFSCSGGRTEDAVAVWGTQIPYLQAVDSPGEEKAVHYVDTVSFPADEFARLLGLDLSGSPAKWFGAVTYTAGRGVDTMIIGDVTFKGTELRQKLGIRSTAFTVSPMGDTIYITTKGFGHRVGMSQYGAEAMAVGGSNFQAILAHYYPGTELTNNNRN